MTGRPSLKDSGLKDRIAGAVNFRSYFSSYLKEITPAGGNEQYLAQCPFHDDTRGSFSINFTTGLWNCKGCGEKGNVFTFHMKTHSLGFREAMFDLGRKYGFGPEIDEYEKKDKGPAMLRPEIAREFHEALLADSRALEYLINLRAISLETIKFFQVGFRKQEKRVTIPIFDPDGQLLNIRKYSHAAKQKMINWTGNGRALLYGWPELAKTPKDEPVIICEGEWDRLILWQHGFKSAITHTNGASSFQRPWGPDFDGRHVILIYDADDGGRKGAHHTAVLLSPHVASIKIVDLKDSGLVKGTAGSNDVSDMARDPETSQNWPQKLREAIAAAPEQDLTELKKQFDEHVKVKEEGEESQGGFVKIFEKDGAYFKHTKSGDAAISNFYLQPTKRIKVSGQEVLEANLLMKDGNGGVPTGEPVVLWPINWVSKAGFKKTLGELGAGYIGSEDDLQELKVLISRKECVKLIGEEKLGIHYLRGQWVFIASDKTLMSDGSEIPEIVHWNQHQTRQTYNVAEVTAVTKAELTEVSHALFSFNHPGISASISGWMFAAAAKARLADAVQTIGKQFPILLLWGQNGAGKSRTAEKVILPFFNDFNEPRKCDELTKFTYMLNASSSNTIPLILEEYKPSRMTQRQMQEVSSFLRAAYNSSTGERGTSLDGALNIKSYTYTAPVVLIGEATNSEPALRDRFIDVMLTLASRAEARPIDIFSKLNMAGAGLGYLTWLLGVSDDTIRREFSRHFAGISPLFKDRPRENVATLKTGISLWGLFLNSQGIFFDTEKHLINMEEYLKTTILEDAERDFIRPKTAIDQIIEGFSAMAATDRRGLLIDEQDWKISPTNDLLYLRIQTAMPKFKKWAHETKFDGEILDENSFRRRLRTEPYFVDRKSVEFGIQNANYAEAKRNVVKAYVLSIYKMQEVGIDLSGFGIEDLPF